MDMQSFSIDLRKALNALPPELVLNWVEQGLKHFAALKAEIPGLVKMMKPHAMAGVMEGSMGVLDRTELERTVKLTFLAVLGDLGADPKTIEALDNLVNVED